jgi:hypothetical protein
MVTIKNVTLYSTELTCKKIGTSLMNSSQKYNNNNNNNDDDEEE